MRTRSLKLFLVAPFLLLAGCATSSSSSEQGSAPSTAQAPAPSDFAPERPLPQTLDEERGFAAAVERSTCTRTGQPGPNYRQQEAKYDLTARHASVRLK